MVHPGDTSLPRLIRRCGRATLFASLAYVLALAAMPAVTAEDRAASDVPQIAVVTPEPPETSGASATPASIAVVKPDEAAGAKSSEQQRRVLMLLLMNSAGPVRPFGNLGR